MGERIFGGCLDFTLALAQFGWDQRQPHAFEDRGLVVARDAAFALEDAVLVNLETALLAKSPDLNIMRLAAGEIM